MTEHTPGPWQVVAADKAEHPWVIGDDEGGSVASCEPIGPWITAQAADANALLIAAAPELLDALWTLRGAALNIDGDAYFDREPSKAALRQLREAIEKASAAIAKAEGTALRGGERDD